MVEAFREGQASLESAERHRVAPGPRGAGRAISRTFAQIAAFLLTQHKGTSNGSILLAATIVLAALGGPVLAQTNQDQPDLSDDQKKSQQNSADEASIKGRLEDGIKPGDPSEQSRANKQLEDAAFEAKRKSDAKPTSKEE